MNDHKSLWKFRTACLKGDTDEMKAICAEDSSFMDRENPDDLEFSFLSRLCQIQVSSRQGDLEKVQSLVEAFPELASYPWSSER